jgi:cytoskeletal protein CcmA (bactofilin family)
MSSTPPTPDPSSTSPASASRRFTDQSARVVTVIGPRTRVQGNLTADESVEVAGTLEGECRVGGLVRVHEGGSITGDVTAGSIVVNGTVSGRSLEADRVEIGAKGRVLGRIRARRVAIADGAFYEGEVDMDDSGRPAARVTFVEKRSAGPDDAAPKG